MNQLKTRGMVLAAGVGSRLDPLTTQLPKPLVPIANRPVMQHILALLKKHGIDSVISNLHYQPEKIQNYFGNGSAFGMNLEFRNEPELTGDAGGMRTCRDFLAGGTFIVMMGDLLTDADLSRIVHEHKSKKALATIALKRVDDVSGFGVAVTNADGFITGFQEKPAAAEALSDRASCGIYVLEPEIFNHIPQSGAYGFGRELFPKLVAAGLPVLGASIDAHYWSDVGTIDQYRQSNLDALCGRVEVDLPGTCVNTGYMEAGARIADGLALDGMLMLGKNSIVGKNVTVKGTVIAGDNCVIDEGTTLEDTIIWSDSKVGSNCDLKGCIVAANCLITSNSSYKNIASVSWPPSLCHSVQEIEA